MKTLLALVGILLLFTTENLWAQTYWTGQPAPATTNWSTAANWIGGTGSGGIAGPNDTATFTVTNPAAGLAISQPGTGVIDTPANIDSFVDSAFPGSISGLTFTNSGTYHNLLIDNALTLNVTGANGLTIGNKSVDFGDVTTYVSIMGPQAILNVVNSNATVFMAQASGTTGCRMNVDLSALGKLNAITTNFLVAAGSSSEGIAEGRPGAVVYLARTNFITATASGTSAETSDTANNAVGLDVSDSDGNADNQACFLYLGWTNVIYANSIATARQKAPASAMLFNPNLINLIPPPTAYFRAANGTSPVATWTIADGVVNSGSSLSALGTNDFTGGVINALVNTMYIGHTSSSTAGTHACTGTLSFDAGLINVNSLYVGYQSASETAWGVGTINVGTNVTLGLGANLVVNQTFVLGYTVGGTGAALASGTLNILGGTVDSYSIVPGVGEGTINMYGGLLYISNSIGSSTIPCTGLLLSNATLTIPVGATPSVWVNTLTIDGQTTTTNIINITSLPAAATYPATFKVIQMTNEPASGPPYQGQLNNLNGTFNLGLGTLPGIYTGYLVSDTANSSIDVVITGGPPPASPVHWDGAASANWNFTDLNWKPASGTDVPYVDGDFVTFDDSLTGSSGVNLTVTASPGSVTFANELTNYTLSGTGGLAGETGLSVTGSGLVVLNNSGANTFLGTINIGTLGDLQIGRDDADGGLPNGGITLNGTLSFDRTDTLTVPNTITGAGQLIQEGTNVLTFGGDNFDFTGTVFINSGTVRIGGINALGSGTGTSIINTNGGTLDFNSTFGSNQVMVGGAGVGGTGALVNNGNTGPGVIVPAVSFVTMVTNTTLGGTGQWELRPGDATTVADTDPPTFAGLSTEGHPFNLTKVGVNAIGICSATVDPALATINIAAGTLIYEGTTTGLGNPAAPLLIQSNATLQLTSDANPLDKLIFVNDDGTITATTSGNSITGPIVLNTNVVSGAPAHATFSVGGPSGSSLTVLSTISGGGSLTLTGTNELYLQGTNTYTGETLINSGSLFLAQGGAISNSQSIVIASNATLDASQLNVGPWYLNSGQTLMGNGTVNSSVTVLPGATITVGTNATDIGALTINNSLTLEGTTLLKLDAGAQTNDVLDVDGGITFGGELVLSNITGVPLQAGQTFTLFYGSYSGSFTSVSSPGPFLAWDTDNLTVNGSVTVLQPIPGFTVANESGTNLFVRGGGGPVGGTYYILSTTNLALPTTAWTIVSTNQFDANGNFSASLPIIPSMPGVYYTYEIPAGQ